MGVQVAAQVDELVVVLVHDGVDERAEFGGHHLEAIAPPGRLRAEADQPAGRRVAQHVGGGVQVPAHVLDGRRLQGPADRGGVRGARGDLLDAAAVELRDVIGVTVRRDRDARGARQALATRCIAPEDRF